MSRQPFLDPLRGLAALAVVLFHLTHLDGRSPGGPADEAFTWLASHGSAGVYVFFALSGFVLPWSLDRKGGPFGLAEAGNFLLRRFFRLWPPGAVVLLGCAFYHHGLRLEGAWSRLWPQLCLVSSITGEKRWMEVFWTLEQEAQFCLALPLLFPLLVHRSAWARRALLAALCLAPLATTSRVWMPEFLGFFSMGFAVFWQKSGRCSRWEMLLWLAAAAAGSWRDFSGIDTAAGLLGAGLIAWSPAMPRPFHWLGVISYSLYLTHCIAQQATMLFWPVSWTSGPALAGWTLLHVAAAILLAAAGYWVLEKPSLAWAKRVGRKPPQA